MRFRIVLWVIGTALAAASRLSPRIRAQLSRDMTLKVESLDGVARSFVVRGRRVSSHGGKSPDAPDAVSTLSFSTAALGARVLLAPDAIGQIVDGLGTKDIVCRGEAAIVLWFYELTMGLLPWRRRPSEHWPDSYVAPDPSSKVFSRIVREPAAESLPLEGTDAHEQRDKVLLWRVGRGAVPEGKVKSHKIVVDVPSDHGADA